MLSPTYLLKNSTIESTSALDDTSLFQNGQTPMMTFNIFICLTVPRSILTHWCHTLIFSPPPPLLLLLRIQSEHCCSHRQVFSPLTEHAKTKHCMKVWKHERTPCPRTAQTSLDHTLLPMATYRSRTKQTRTSAPWETCEPLPWQDSATHTEPQPSSHSSMKRTLIVAQIKTILLDF